VTATPGWRIFRDLIIIITSRRLDYLAALD
jgi:hypothetical protein